MVKYKQDSDSVFSGINIVPFTDIILVLLIVFMIAAPGIFSAGLNLTLPGAKSAGNLKKDRLRVNVNKEGKLYFKDQELTLEALEKKFVALIESGTVGRVIINADVASRHGRVIEVLDRLRGIGVKDIFVGTVKK